MLRLFYACYYAGMGVSVAFFSRYLHSLGLSGRQISFMLAAAPLLNLCGVPLVWGSIADRTRRPDLVLRLVSLFACVLMVPMIFVRTLPGMLLLYAGYQAFAVAIMGLIDSIALERVRQGADYGRIRLWGSFAFALATPLVGQLLDWRGRSGGDPLVPGLIAGAIGATFLTSLTVRGQATPERPHASELGTLLRDRRFLFLLVVAPLLNLCGVPLV
ncbi:MAG TPA: MFS transporter, partial [Polyangia bacterium]|nr:MFS transporter [Polyangia bacterium]